MSIQGIQNNIQYLSGKIRRMQEQKPADNAADRTAGLDQKQEKPVYDEYIPGDHFKPQSNDADKAPADGKPSDQVKKAADGKEKEAEKTEPCTGNTDKVDREIQKLKKKKEQLEQQIQSETDEKKVEKLKKELSQVEGELRQKDNEAYRRQHTVFF